MLGWPVRIGFREATFALDGFYLNGRRVKLLGVNRHQFFPFAGGAMPARVQARDAEIIRRELNCTMVRCSHYPQSETFFDACDELGLLAWEGSGVGLSGRRGLAGARRPRHQADDGPGPQPPVDRDLGRPAQRDAQQY